MVLQPNRAQLQELLSAHPEVEAKLGWPVPRPRRTRRAHGRPAPGRPAPSRQAWTAVCAQPTSRCPQMVRSVATRLCTPPRMVTSPPCQLWPEPSQSSTGQEWPQPRSLLCPCSSSWAARQPSKALRRPPIQATCQGSQGWPSTVRQESIWFPPGE